MKVLILPDDLFVYLQHVHRAYAGGGIDPEEGLAIYQLGQALKNVQTVDESQVAKGATDTPVPATEHIRSQGDEEIKS